MGSGPPEPYPLLLAPVLHRRVWGGDWLETLYAGHGPTIQAGPEGDPMGESWLAGGASVVQNGAHAGRSVAELAEEMAADLVGEVAYARYWGRMPLLAKLLDAREALSVQVHPDDEYALRHESGSGHLGKSEAWYVLAAEPGAEVLWGFERSMTPAEVRAAVEDGSLPEAMQRVKVSRGSVVVNPAGTVHAVGAGIRLYEIQQESDLTYRLYDHGRVGADGRPRDLHLEESLAVADLSGRPFRAEPPLPLPGGWERLVARPEFVLDRARLTGAETAFGSTDGASLQLLTLVSGAATLRPAGGAEWGSVDLRPGATVLLPAALPGAYELAGEGELLRAAVTDPSATPTSEGPGEDG